jgi:hypothetical protein
MAAVVIVVSERGVQECRIPVTSNLSQQRASRELLDKISPVVTSLHQLLAEPTEEPRKS